MRASIPLATLVLVTGAMSIAPASHAQQSTPTTLNAQQERMKTCNAEASSQQLAGDARKTFMSDCLSGKTTSASGTSTGNAQQDKMRACNLQASNRHLQGDARKSFVSDCLRAQ
jgi:hypothetical protein